MPTEATEKEAKTYAPSGLLQYLPAIYSEDPFLGQFLLAFEKILLGREDSPPVLYIGASDSKDGRPRWVARTRGDAFARVRTESVPPTAQDSTSDLVELDDDDPDIVHRLFADAGNGWLFGYDLLIETVAATPPRFSVTVRALGDAYLQRLAARPEFRGLVLHPSYDASAFPAAPQLVGDGDAFALVVLQNRQTGTKTVDTIQVASGDPDLNPKGLEQIIDGLAALYDPINTPEEFLPWLSQWTALSLRADMTIEQQRRFVAQVIQLYRYRGTQENLLNLLELFLTATPTIVVDDAEPYFFHVTIKLPRMSQEFTRRQFEIAQALVEQEKPAHTDYKLLLDTPTMQIGTYSTVGVDTLLGTTEEDSTQASNPPAK